MLRRLLFSALLLIAFDARAQVRSTTPKVGDPPEAMNMRLVGWDSLQAGSIDVTERSRSCLRGC